MAKLLGVVGAQMKLRLNTDDIQLNQPIDWDLYNKSGRRLFKKGFIVHSEQNLKQLLELELYYDPNASISLTSQQKPEREHREPQKISELQSSGTMQLPKYQSGVPARVREISYALDITPSELNNVGKHNLFIYLDYFNAQEKCICDGIINGRTDMLPYIETLANYLEKIFSQATDACLGAIHIDYEHLYSTCHPLYSALLSLLISKGLGINENNRKSLICAALTANVGMYEYYDHLISNDAELTKEELGSLQAHPELSSSLLIANKVTKQKWLDIVIQHHERGDGSGYPKGLQRDQICMEASILAIVDTYLSFIMPRAYRKSIPPKIAMQKIYQTAVAQDDTLSIGLIKQLGIYPPGSLVQLANDDIAIVIERNMANNLAPTVARIGRINGDIYSNPIRCATNTDTYKITGPYISDVKVEIDMNKLWEVDIAL
jgi:HD-GYP domain-containing protein (c-di-GMP phosphodiesterase class II)